MAGDLCTSPGIMLLSPDRRNWRDTRGKWPLARNPGRKRCLKLFWPQPMVQRTAGLKILYGQMSTLLHLKNNYKLYSKPYVKARGKRYNLFLAQMVSWEWSAHIERRNAYVNLVVQVSLTQCDSGNRETFVSTSVCLKEQVTIYLVENGTTFTFILRNIIGWPLLIRGHRLKTVFYMVFLH